MEAITNGWIFVLANIVVFLIIAALCALVEIVKKKYHPKYVLFTVLFGH